MISVNVVRPVGRVPQNRQMSSREFVRFANRFEIPVSPVYRIVEYRYSEYVRHRGTGKNDPAIVSLQIGECYVIEMSVRPEYSVGEVVYRQGIRPGYVVLPGENLREVATVHSHFSDVRLKTFIRYLLFACQW